MNARRALVFATVFMLLASLCLYAEPATAAGNMVALKYRGTTTLSATTTTAATSFALNAAAPPFGASNEISNSDVERELPKEGSNTSQAGDVPGNPASNPIVGGKRGQKGFDGLSHYDQRTASNGNQFSLEPPDQALCVGNGYIIEGVNTALVAYNNSGTRLSPVVALNKFYNFPPSIDRVNLVYGDFTSDPKCYYDKDTNRWFFTILQLNVNPATGAFTGPSHVELAVSKTGNPLGVWNLYELDTTNGTGTTPSHPGCPCLGDQPLIGADKNGFYISTNEFSTFGPEFNGAQIYAISKRALAQGLTSVSAVYVAQGLPLAEGPSYSVQPATTPPGGEYEAEGNGAEYFMSSLDFNATTDNRVAVWALTNTRSLNNANPNLKLSNTIIHSEVYGQPPDATQKPGPTPLRDALNALGYNEPLEKLAGNDDRMNQVVWADGHLWSGVNTAIGSGANKRVGIAYFIVTPNIEPNGTVTAEMRNQGYVVAPGQNNVLYPSIGVNQFGEALMTFTLSGPDYYPSTGFTKIQDDERSPDEKIYVSGPGVAPEDGFTGYSAYGGDGTARWGDYSAAVAGPDGKIYMAAEFIPSGPRTTLANWGTHVTIVQWDQINDD